MSNQRKILHAVLLPLALSFVASANPSTAQTPKQPAAATARRAAEVREGASLFRANCSPCHGLGAHGGGRGPDLTSGRWAHGSSDVAIFATITHGVPGTEMPANAFEDSEVRAIVAYLRSLAPSKDEAVTGNAKNGDKLFHGSAACGTCHMVSGSGGLLGPDLSRVGAARSVTYLIDSIRDPNKDLSLGMSDPNDHYGLPLVYDTVTVTTNSGEKILGVARNEDTFSVQLMGTDQQLHFFVKSEVNSVVHERASLMPPYPEKFLRASDLNDIVAYLVSLRGERVEAPGAK
jgi:cytochrome c oxidase cbb3-type subunit III